MIRGIGFIVASGILAAAAVAETDAPATQPDTPAATQPAPATTQADAPAPLIGQWQVHVVPTEAAAAAGARAADHLLTFDDQRLKVHGPLGSLFGSTLYEFRTPDFRAVFDREDAGNALWVGELMSDGTLRGMIHWTRRDGSIQIYLFTGHRTDDGRQR